MWLDSSVSLKHEVMYKLCNPHCRGISKNSVMTKSLWLEAPSIAMSSARPCWHMFSPACAVEKFSLGHCVPRAYSLVQCPVDRRHGHCTTIISLSPPLCSAKDRRWMKRSSLSCLTTKLNKRCNQASSVDHCLIDH